MSDATDQGDQRPRVVVIGAGITGLAAAYELAHQDQAPEVVLLESSARVGGNINTEHRDGYLIDGGPDSFVRTKPQATALVRELGLESELITTATRGVFVVHQGQLELMPAGMALAVPTRLGPMLATPLLTLEGKARMLGDLLLPAGFGRTTAEEESIGAFLERRFGAEAKDILAGPLLGGIYAGDVDQLSLEATFPQLVSVELKHGSLIRGLFAAAQARAKASDGRQGLWQLLQWLRRDEQETPSPFYSLRRGMGALVDALVDRLPAGTLRTQSPVESVTRHERRWRVELRRGEVLGADAVILATPARVAARLLDAPPLVSELDAISYVSTATVFLAYSRSEVAHPLNGVGFIVPRGQARIIAATWVSSKWEGRAPEGCVLMRAFLGGTHDVVNVDERTDEELVEVSRTELMKYQGHLGEPRFTRVFRYPRSNVQPVVGHAARCMRLKRLLKEQPGLLLAGGSYEGVGIPDCIQQGRATAQEALQLLPHAITN